MVVLLFFVFSTIGLSLLQLTQIYLKTSGFRRNSLFLDYAAENGVKLGFAMLRDRLGPLSSPIVLTEEESMILRADSARGGKAVGERALGCDMPLMAAEQWERMEWEASVDLRLMKIREYE
ncbi:MAG: hypothetical protein ACE5LV_09480, partial [Candidatus Aminicenantales bacterium]